MDRRYMYLLINVLLIGLFMYTGVSKLANGPLFERQMMSQPFPDYFSTIIIHTLPYLEILTAGFLVIGRTRSMGLMMACALMFVFTTYVGLIWLGAFDQVPCSCGGVLQGMGWGEHLVFNLIFLMISGMAWRIHQAQRITNA